MAIDRRKGQSGGTVEAERTHTTTSVLSLRTKRALWIGGALLVVAMATLFVLENSPVQDATPSSAVREASEIQARPLVDRWVRSDGGYVIEIRGSLADGNLDAAYFNPDLIHVSRAEWRQRGAHLEVLVELRDVNYPGSTYVLEYLPAEDRLVGLYYQAVERRTFNVEFVREN
jgi:hypothetical protein